METETWKTELYRHRSLWQVYKDAFLYIQRAKINTRILAGSLLGLTIISGISCLVLPPENLKTFISSICDFCLSYTLSILGFLVTGFAIFASVTRPELFVMLAKMPDRADDKHLSKLQNVFFNFLTVFINFFGLLCISLFIKVTYLLIDALPEEMKYKIIRSDPFDLLLAIEFIVVGTWLISSLLRLKSFIWNLYQSVVLSIASADLLNKPQTQNPPKIPET